MLLFLFFWFLKWYILIISASEHSKAAKVLAANR
jgi:hypothetical protein